MHDYDTIRNALMIFSTQTDLSHEAAERALQQCLQHPAWKQRLQEELESLLADPRPPWLDLISNDAYEVDEPEDAEDARAMVLELLWAAAFPGRTIP